MKKRKAYEVSIINKTYSKTYLDQTKFYTSDTALELVFQLKEIEYNFDSAELILLNDEDRSLTTRPVKKTAEGFTYELEDDIVEHYGTWSGQLKFTEGSEIYVSSPVGFRIHNDLYNDRPPQMNEVNTWKNLRLIADKLIADIRSELELVAVKNSEMERAESERQNSELNRVENETIRKEWFENTNLKLKNLNTFGNQMEVKGYYSINNIQTNNLKLGDKIYATRKFVNVNGVSNNITGRVAFGGSIVIANKSFNSGVATLEVDLINRMNLYGNDKPDENGLNVSYFNDLIIINLTEAFGTGNEPTVKDMDELVKITGYFDGEIVLTPNQMFTLLLNLNRNNTNAIISLGGTI